MALTLSNPPATPCKRLHRKTSLGDEEVETPSPSRPVRLLAAMAEDPGTPSKAKRRLLARHSSTTDDKSRQLSGQRRFQAACLEKIPEEAEKLTPMKVFQQMLSNADKLPPQSTPGTPIKRSLKAHNSDDLPTPTTPATSGTPIKPARRTDDLPEATTPTKTSGKGSSPKALRKAQEALRKAQEKLRATKAKSMDDTGMDSAWSRMDTIEKVQQLTRRITQQCQNSASAAKMISALRRSVGQPLSHFTLPLVDEAWKRCLAFYNEAEDGPDLAGYDSSSDSNTDDDSPTSELGSSQERKQKRAGRRERDAMLLESLLEDPEEELSGEEEVDDEEPVEPDRRFCLEWPPRDSAVVPDDGYPVAAWANEQAGLLPGSGGFNKRCTAVMQQVGVARTLHTELSDTVACPPLQPHQESVSFLLHPKSPVSRLLIDHPTGSGKTWEIIRVLDNYFHDPRPKVPIFPKSPVCRNFYAELLRWPNRYRDYFCCMRPAHAALACGCPDWREKRNCMWKLNHFLEEELRFLCYEIRSVLEMKDFFYMGTMRPGIRTEFAAKNPGESMPAGPMRALSYTSAGGTFVRLREQGDIPRSAMMKIGYTQGCHNVYTNKVVVMDEAHNLVRTQTQYGEQLQCLRDLLVKAENVVVAGFTGTPILSKPEEGRQLLDIIKGCNAPAGDEGYLSSFPMRPEKLFPVSLPRGIPDAILTRQLQGQLVVRVELCGDNLRVYDRKRKQGLTNRMLSAYCNMCTFFGNFHDGKHGSKEKILNDPDNCCPKFQAIAEEVAASPLKAVVMVRKQSGYNVVLELLRQVARSSNPPFAVATIDELTEYNHVSNLRGEKYRVLVADSAQCSEGVSFLAVRRVFYADVATSPSQMVQQCGRAIRMFGHHGLPKEEQVVTNHLYIATFPKWLHSSLAHWVFRLFRHVKDGEAETYAKKMMARLLTAGIRTLKDLKDEIDAFGERKRKSLHPYVEESDTKETLTVPDIILFLELAGLWDEQPDPVSKAPSSSSSKAAPRMHPQVAKSARFAALAAGSSRLAEITSRMVGAAPPRVPGNKKKATSLGNQLKNSVRAAGKNLEDANKAFTSLSQAVAIVQSVCEQIDRFVAPAIWQAELQEKLTKPVVTCGLHGVRDDECVAGAIRASAHLEFNAKEGDLKELNAREVKQLLHHLTRAEKVLALSSGYLGMKELCPRVEDCHCPDSLEIEMRELLKREPVLTALKELAPDNYARRDSGGLSSLDCTQLIALRDALERLRKSDKLAAAWSPQSLVKAVRDLYLSRTLEFAMQTLEIETADEQALSQLADQTAEFVPALAELRSKAIDSEILSSFVESSSANCNGGTGAVQSAAVDMEAEDGEEAAEDGEGDEPKPVILPVGWKLQWVQQIAAKAKDQMDKGYRFVDPDGQKFYSVSEFHTAQSGGLEAVLETRRMRQESRAAEAAERTAMAKAKTPMGFGGQRRQKKQRCKW